MGLNKKGILFSIISLMISLLIITIYSLTFSTNFESEIAQINSRAELFDVTFNIVENNIASVVASSSRQALENMAQASYYLYDNVTHTAHDLNAACEFKNLMTGGTIRIFNSTQQSQDLIFEIPGAQEIPVGCPGINTLSFTPGTAFIQEFVPDSQVFIDVVRVGINSSNGDRVIISILDSCKYEIARYEGPAFNSPGNSCQRDNYPLDKQIELLTNQTYYIYIEGPATSSIKLGQPSIHPESNFIIQDKNLENMSVANYGYDPALTRTVADFMDDVNVFLNETYKTQSNYELKDINIRQENPWEAIAEGTVIVNLQDPYFKVSKAIPFSTTVSLVGLQDPMFSKFRESRTIIRERAVQENKLNITHLAMLIDNSSYVKDTLSPSFLQRFSNDLNGSRCCGVQTYFDPRGGISLNEHDALTNNTISAWRLLNKLNLCEESPGRLHSILLLYATAGFPPNTFDDTILDEYNFAKYNITTTNSIYHQYNEDECNP